MGCYTPCKTRHACTFVSSSPFHSVHTLSERPHHPHLLLQSLHRTGLTHRYRPQRCRFHRFTYSTIIHLQSHPFLDITMYETLVRPHKVSHIPHLESIALVSQRLQQADINREQKRLRQIANNKRKREDSSGDESPPESKPILDKQLSVPPSSSSSRLSVSSSLPQVRGHTSYLTFAVLVPFSVPLQLPEA